MKAHSNASLPVFPEDCASLLKKYLTQSIWEALADKTTATGFSFTQAIRSGVEQTDSGVGVYAGDEESYSLFAPLLMPIIEKYHGSAGLHPATDFSVEGLPEVTSAAASRILSTRVRVGRNLAGFPMGAAITSQQRLDVETQIVDALAHLPASIQGKYHSLAAMPDALKKDLVSRHLLFKSEDRFMRSGNLMRDWPSGRGLFLSHDESFSAWINEEDQLRIIALQSGGDVKAVFSLLAEGVTALSKHLAFLSSEALGYLASCPTNLGTSMRASVHIRLPFLSQDEAALKRQAEALGLQVRGLHGEHSASEGATYDMSNRMRLGVTEAQSVTHLINGINEMAATDERGSA